MERVRVSQRDRTPREPTTAFGIGQFDPATEGTGVTSRDSTLLI